MAINDSVPLEILACLLNEATVRERYDVRTRVPVIPKRDRTTYKIYNGWWYLGRPTSYEIRMDRRALVQTGDNWIYQGET